jgi:hypothetical protein
VNAIDAENPDAGDLALLNGQILLTPSESVATLQRLKVAFQFFRGEWFLDTRQGVPWYQRILIKGSNERVNRSIFRQIIEKDPGVARLERLRYSLNRSTRELDLDFTARLKSGVTLRARDFGPFLIEV